MKSLYSKKYYSVLILIGIAIIYNSISNHIFNAAQNEIISDTAINKNRLGNHLSLNTLINDSTKNLEAISDIQLGMNKTDFCNLLHSSQDLQYTPKDISSLFNLPLVESFIHITNANTILNEIWVMFNHYIIDSNIESISLSRRISTCDKDKERMAIINVIAAIINKRGKPEQMYYIIESPKNDYIRNSFVLMKWTLSENARMRLKFQPAELYDKGYILEIVVHDRKKDDVYNTYESSSRIEKQPLSSSPYFAYYEESLSKK